MEVQTRPQEGPRRRGWWHGARIEGLSERLQWPERTSAAETGSLKDLDAVRIG